VRWLDGTTKAAQKGRDGCEIARGFRFIARRREETRKVRRFAADSDHRIGEEGEGGVRPEEEERKVKAVADRRARHARETREQRARGWASRPCLGSAQWSGCGRGEEKIGRMGRRSRPGSWAAVREAAQAEIIPFLFLFLSFFKSIF
jgi:hypothetical protein